MQEETVSKYVHLRVEYYPPNESRKRHIRVKVDAERWDDPEFRQASYLNGQIQVAGGMGSRPVSCTETKRTKT